MNSFLKTTVDSLNSYCEVLATVGQIGITETRSILILSFLQDLLKFVACGFVTESDYKHIIKATYCICEKSRIIQFPKFEVYDDLVNKNIGSFIPRITEDTILRGTESEDIRIKV